MTAQNRHAPRHRLRLIAFTGLLFAAWPSRAVDTLDSALAAAREGSPAPALAALRLRCGGPIEIAVQGRARVDRTETLGDAARFNVGSNAKSMLASLAATYVQEGRLRWDSTVAELLAPQVQAIHPGLAGASLAQLLSHRSGLPAYASGAELSAVQVGAGTPSEQRLAFARQVLAAPPSYPVGTRFLYSNAGYIVAGLMLEQLGGEPFEVLMQRRLFAPLGMRAGFGSPMPPGAGQPWGHYRADGAQKVYEDADPVIPAFLQAAGDVSLSMADYARYLQEHLCGLRDAPTHLLKPATVRALHEPQGADGGGMGWGRYELGGSAASVHVGGTGTFSSFVALLPERNLAVATSINSGDEGARKAALGLLQRLVRPEPAEAPPR